MESDEKLESTAVRETQEEIGINADDIEIIGSLSPLFIPVTGFIITPFIGFINIDFVTDPAPDEVENVFSVSLDELLNDKNKLHEKRNLRGL
jgi:8-oxo-dGTP pyrophosphatase MutT (NUDIX family)